MRNLVRGSVVLVVAALALTCPRAAAAHDTGYPHRHVYGAGVPGMPTLNIDRPGVYLGAALVGNIVVNQTDAPTSDGFISHGGGAQLLLGVRIIPYLGLEFAYTQTVHNPVQDSAWQSVSYLALHALTADLKLIFPNRSNVRPYLQAGLGYYFLTKDYQDAVSGGGFQLGGGVDIWLNPWWSLGARVLYHGIKFDNVGIPGAATSKPFLSTASLDLNVQVHF
jgi:opacity protein-like surface antigen